MYDLIIIGSGPAGLSAGVYAQRAKISTLLLEKEYVNGGQIMSTYEVDNYLGLPGISGMDLCDKFLQHAEKMGLPIEQGEVTGIQKKGDFFLVETEGENYQAKSVLIASGAHHRMLGVPGENQLSGMGVSYCATCDGAFFRGKTVAVVGGGDVALEDAIFLARICEKVYIIHRRNEFRGASMLREKVKSLDNVEILWDSVVEEILGEEQVDGVEVKNRKTDESMDVEVDGVFIAVGICPNTQAYEGLLKLDASKFICTDENCGTSIPGIYAAGDIRTKSLRQIITAAADGAVAVNSVEKYLMTFRGKTEKSVM